MAYYINNTDHGGADFTLANGDYIAGSHTNIRTLTIPAGAIVYVYPYNGSYGSCYLYARSIVIAGSLNATGMGYYGGNGQSGRPGFYGWNCYNYVGYAGPAGSGPYGGAGGAAGAAVYVSDASKPNGNPGGHAYYGGYLGSQANGDTTTDETLWMGSGGGGGASGGSGVGANGNWIPGSGSGSGAGGRGGGLIYLSATASVIISGAIISQGQYGGNGGAGNNGCYQCGTSVYGGAAGVYTTVQSGAGGGATAGSSWCTGGGAGGYGRPGCGGGVLIKCVGPLGVEMKPGSYIDTRAGDGSTARYGSTKFHTMSGRRSLAGTLYTGHTGSGGYGYPLQQNSVATHINGSC